MDDERPYLCLWNEFNGNDLESSVFSLEKWKSNWWWWKSLDINIYFRGYHEFSSNFFINCKLNQHEKSDELYNIINIFNTDVNIFKIFWHRVVIDEFHEIEDSNLFIRLNFYNY